jgi:hypothetical protein
MALCSSTYAKADTSSFEDTRFPLSRTNQPNRFNCRSFAQLFLTIVQGKDTIGNSREERNQYQCLTWPSGRNESYYLPCKGHLALLFSFLTERLIVFL